MILVPYIQIAGKWTLPDDAMQGLYRMMNEEGTAKTFFYSGTVKNEEDFVKACRSDTHTVIILEESGEPVAMGFLNNFEDKSAHAHWLTFRRSWGTSKTRQAIRMALEYWFHFMHDGAPLFEVLLGIYPTENRRIDKFARQAGFTIIGEIPHLLNNYWEDRLMGATISYIERGQVWAE